MSNQSKNLAAKFYSPCPISRTNQNQKNGLLFYDLRSAGVHLLPSNFIFSNQSSQIVLLSLIKEFKCISA